MKLLHLQLLPLLTGVQNFSLHLLEGLDPTEFEIHVASQPGGPLVEAVRQRGYIYHPLSQLRHPISVRDVLAFWQIYRLMRNERFDIVHTNSSKPGLLGRMAARLAGVPLIIHSSHGTPFQRGQHISTYLLYVVLEWLAGRFCDFVAFVNHSDRLNCVKMGVIPSDKAVTIYNALPSEQVAKLTATFFKTEGQRDRDFRETEEDAEGGNSVISKSDSARDPLFVKTEGQRDRDFGGTEVLNKDGRSVASNSDSTRESIPHANKDVSGSIMVGSTLRFSTQKNILEVILAACEACALEPRLRFVFIGEGEHFQLCKAIVSSKGLNERILLPGWDSDVSIWLSQMDVFMLYSRWEALPFSIIEANFSGLPVIGSSIPSIKELVNEEVGWLVPLDDRSALVRILTSLPHQAGAISQKGHLARQRIGQLCSYESMVDAYLKLYRSK